MLKNNIKLKAVDNFAAKEAYKAMIENVFLYYNFK